MRCYTWMLFVMLGVCGLPISHAIACEKKPEVTFGEKPFDATDPNGGTLEFVIVNGVPWKHAYWKSAIPGVTMQSILPDCRVIIVGRKDLSFYVVIEDVEWVHPVYNSSYVMFSGDGRQIVHIGAKEFVLNDVPYPAPGVLKNAGFNERGDFEAEWKRRDGKHIQTVNGIIVE